MGKPLKEQVADRIKTLLAEKGWKQADLARETGFNKGYVSLVLSCEKNLTLETIERFEKALGEKVLQVL